MSKNSNFNQYASGAPIYNNCDSLHRYTPYKTKKQLKEFSQKSLYFSISTYLSIYLSISIVFSFSLNLSAREFMQQYL